MNLTERCTALIQALDLGHPDQVTLVRPLTGGVASDIAEVRVAELRLCAKFALPKLRVQAEWLAPVHRNRAEFEWLSYVHGIAPENAPKLYGRSEDMHGFAMEFLTGEDTYLWKDALLAERPERGEAAAVATLLGRIHNASAKPGFDTSAFQNHDDFRALRIEPYLLFTATRHPQLAEKLQGLADMLYSASIALIHGDVSPKNIMLRNGAPVILDAECATMGDPCFDVAFCLNHLMLKAVHLPQSAPDLIARLTEFRDSYLPFVDWENPDQFEARVAALLPALFLARVDGKSPVEYLDDAARDHVRRIALALLNAGPGNLDEVAAGFLKERNNI
ncbi:aminoglycoside phosphotransferase family protein [Paracoccus sp. Z330]|uniref:Aminoglycoside phosphotransferase family protein n=1 Tax=Paracoccus onchidii TaxID=3017813 RepID=A0ABT4ZAH9_9RHOB|nr:aminoglycoside phosphotransferase family protein [Paracoccus onchidii]MDB6176358.1 aminoglycoside phosphotransferase family protein [Paracoccus onchidii]